MKKVLSILLVVIILMSTLVSCKIDDLIQKTTTSTTSTTSTTATTSTTTTTTTNNESPLDPPEEDKYSKGLEFTLNDDGESYSLTGIGTCTDVDIVIPSTYNGLPVTNIADAAFAAVDLETGEILYSSITSITIPDSVISIGNYVFFYCISLTSIEIPNSVTTIGNQVFFGCISLTSIEIPNSVTTIGSGAFSFCLSLSSIVIGESVTSIGDSAFGMCTSLASVVIGKSVTNIGDNAFNGCYSLIEVINKSSLNIAVGSSDYGNVGYYAKCIITDESQSAIKIVDDCIFYDDGIDIYLVKYMGSDTEIVLPEYDGGKEYGIWNYAFYDDEITSIIIPDSVTSIGNYAFMLCTSLTTVTIPDSVISIGDYAFYACLSLTSVVIGKSVTSISDYAFVLSSSIIEVINKSSLDIVAGSISNGYVASNAKYVITDGSESGIKIEGDYVFYDNGAEVYLVKYLGNDTEVTLPEYDGGKEYGVYGRAFDIVDNEITTINIPNSVTIFDEYVFYNCSSLTNINFEGTIEQWNDIEKNSHWDYTLGEYTIYCTDGEIPPSAQ